MEIKIDTTDQDRLLAGLNSQTDAEANRMKRYLAMPDLSRTDGSPLSEIVKKARAMPILKDFDNIIIPEIVPADISFDMFDFAPDHPARSKSDTYYLNENSILRTHDTVMWYYYLNLPEIKEKIAAKETLRVICFGKVYRKDEIDRKHMNVFHQFGGLYLAPEDRERLSQEDLKEALSQIVRGLFGDDVEFRFNKDTFPYTDESLEVEVKVGDNWVEILGGGLPKKNVLENFGVKGYNGWAFGFGLERLAIIGMDLPDIRLLWSQDERVKKQLVLGQKYQEVSKYPPVVRDISFIVEKANFAPNDYFDLVRDVVGDMAEEMALIDEYENAEKFGEGKKSYAYRVTYRALDRTLTDAEVNEIHKKLEDETRRVFGATIR